MAQQESMGGVMALIQLWSSSADRLYSSSWPVDSLMIMLNVHMAARRGRVGGAFHLQYDVGKTLMIFLKMLIIIVINSKNSCIMFWDILAFYLANILALFLAFYLTFYFVSGISSGILSGR